MDGKSDAVSVSYHGSSTRLQSSVTEDLLYAQVPEDELYRVHPILGVLKYHKLMSDRWSFTSLHSTTDKFADMIIYFDSVAEPNTVQQEAKENISDQFASQQLRNWQSSSKCGKNDDSNSIVLGPGWLTVTVLVGVIFFRITGGTRGLSAEPGVFGLKWMTWVADFVAAVVANGIGCVVAFVFHYTLMDHFQVAILFAKLLILSIRAFSSITSLVVSSTKSSINSSPIRSLAISLLFSTTSLDKNRSNKLNFSISSLSFNFVGK
ncbi:hypothetical protein Bhyg_06805 [Pseudolycoriella hygida]|uniref:Uncharacterized protein n=1 Tax=Pseudolycoriella hygida TaxID=35572 RepID=A0A9Q0S376_9DIPT|nr:hypothetical protein Bhyg_06805 [Pseudolycoriella hygida]